MSETNEPGPAQPDQEGLLPSLLPLAPPPGAPGPEGDQGRPAGPIPPQPPQPPQPPEPGEPGESGESDEPLPTFMWSSREEQFLGEIQADDKTMGLLCHLLGIFTGFLGPLIIWLLKKDESPYVDAHGKESLNFQISISIYMVVAYVTIFAFVGCVLFPAVIIFDLVMCIIATVKANDGIVYRYPLAIRFIK